MTILKGVAKQTNVKAGLLPLPAWCTTWHNKNSLLFTSQMPTQISPAAVGCLSCIVVDTSAEIELSDMKEWLLPVRR